MKVRSSKRDQQIMAAESAVSEACARLEKQTGSPIVTVGIETYGDGKYCTAIELAKRPGSRKGP